MKAHARSLRIAPKKANLIAKMVRGVPVPVAFDMLRRTNKKAARMVEKLLKSAVANAQHNDKQQGSSLVIKTIIVNQGTGYRRGVPMARGRMRPMVKFLSHISLTLGVRTEDRGQRTEDDEKSKKETRKHSAKPKNSVKSTAKTKEGSLHDASTLVSSSLSPKS